jgi:hypothetical protein
MLLLGCLFALVRLFALPISILIAQRLGYIVLTSNWDVFWLMLLLGFFNVIIRPLLQLFLVLFSLPFVISLGLSKAAFDFITRYVILFFANSIVLYLSCKMIGITLVNWPLATLTISVSAYLISMNASASFVAMGPKGPAAGGAKKSDGSDVIDI